MHHAFGKLVVARLERRQVALRLSANLYADPPDLKAETLALLVSYCADIPD